MVLPLFYRTWDSHLIDKGCNYSLVIPSGVARRAKNLICAPASQAYVERIFSVCGLLHSGR